MHPQIQTKERKIILPKFSFPNQRMIKINREKVKNNFLGINNETWQSAARDLGAHAFLLYIYLSSNANGFNLALSPKDIRQSVGMPESTYRDQFKKLIDKGYLVDKGSNRFDFFEKPQRDTQTLSEDVSSGFSSATIVLDETLDIQKSTADNREININSLKNNNINNENQKQNDIFKF